MPLFRDRLRELRKGAGWTQQKLAEVAGLHYAAITQFEQGKRLPTAESLFAITVALGVSCEVFKDCFGHTPKESEITPSPRRRGRPKKQ